MMIINGEQTGTLYMKEWSRVLSISSKTVDTVMRCAITREQVKTFLRDVVDSWENKYLFSLDFSFQLITKPTAVLRCRLVQLKRKNKAMKLGHYT